MPSPMNPTRSPIGSALRLDGGVGDLERRSMISKPSVICSSVMRSGGFVISVHQWTIVYTPLSSRNRLTLAMTSFVTLNGDIGSMVSRFFTRSSTPNSPMLRTARPTGAWPSAPGGAEP